MGTSDLKLNLWLKQRPRLMLCYSKADRGILIGSLLQISKNMSAYRTTYQHSSSCRFLLRWSWRGERRLNCSFFKIAKSTVVRTHEGHDQLGPKIPPSYSTRNQEHVFAPPFPPVVFSVTTSRLHNNQPHVVVKDCIKLYPLWHCADRWSNTQTSVYLKQTPD